MAGREDLTDRLGADKITPGNWGQRLSTTQPRQMNEWPMLFGNSRRFTVGTGSPPVLLKRWSVPTSWNRSLARKIDDMIDGFTDANHPTLPVAMPLLVNGKVICRTFRGVQVADAATGRLLWSTDGQDSVEAMLSGQLDNPQLKMAWNGNPRAFLQQSSTANKTGGPLGQLIFQNAAHGLLSCDGERLYVIEDSPVFTLSRTSIRFRNNQSTVALDGNRLKAYDLETGRPLWEAGGPVSIEEFALPLSGHFFMGPPVADGGDLFVMTESDSEIRLQALDPQTGHPKWSQPIAYAERRIGQDLNRRMWSTHLAVADGTVICPTTVGWLVAVDRTRRSVQWAFRYAPRKKTAERGRRRFSSSQIPAEEINTRWLVSAPIVRGDRLFFTPPEATDEQNRTTGTLVCIELSSGKRLWQRPKTTHLYLAGVLEDRAILVAPDSVKALSLSGKLLWECSFGSDSVPSGRGVTINGILYQPMQRNELIGIHLETGKVVSRQQMPFGERPLGNLLTYRGMLISHHPAEITAWEQKEALDHQLAEIRDQSLDDIDSLLLEAKASTTEGDFDHALSLLDQVSSRESYSTSEDVRQRVDHLVRRVIVSRIRRTPGERPELHDRLQQLAWSPREEAENHQLKFVTLSATDQYSKAFDVLMQLAVLPGEMSFVRADNQRVNAAQDAWLRGQMLDVWAHLSAEEQAQASARLRKIAGQAETDDARRRLARLLAFHPATEPLRHDFARSAVKSGRLHEATGWLMESRWTEKLPEIASLFVQLIEDYQQAGDSLVPIQIATRWRETLSHQPLPDGRSIDELLTQVQDPKRVSRGVDASDWGEFDLNLTRTATSYSYRTARTLNPRSGHRTVCDGLRIEWVQHSYGSVTQRINFINESDGSLYWSVPIRSGTSGPAVYRHFHLGATMVVFSQGVLNCLSIPERRVVWTQLVGTPDNGTSTLKRSFRPMSQGTSFLNEIPGRASMGSGPIPVVNSRYICYRARRRLTILNTQTGAVQWTIRGIPAGTRVFGTLSELYVLPSNGHGDYALRAIDGKQIPHDNIRSILMTALLMKDNLIVTTTLKKGTSRTLLKGLDTGAQIRIQARNFGTDQVLWQQSFPATSQFRGSADDELAILSSDGKLQLLDLLTGHLKELGSLPEISAKRPQAFVLADRSHVYIVLNSQSRSRSYYGDLQTIQASHDIVAFDRQNGKQVWHQKVGTSQANAQRSQSLVVTDLDRNPVMILISSSYEQKLQTQLVKIRVLDKKTGKTLTDYAAPGYPGYRTLKIDLQRRYIDLISYQDRIRLTALTKPAAADGQPVTADSR